MAKAIRLLSVLSLILMAVSVATCHFGPEYDRSLLPTPEEQGFTISPPEPVGDRWIIIGTLLLSVGLGLGVAAIKLWKEEKKKEES